MGMTVMRNIADPFAIAVAFAARTLRGLFDLLKTKNQNHPFTNTSSLLESLIKGKTTPSSRTYKGVGLAFSKPRV